MIINYGTCVVMLGASGGGEWQYTFNGEDIVLTKYTGSNTQVTVPTQMTV